jgi:transcriptional regulator GlxA family with amidase domain
MHQVQIIMHSVQTIKIIYYSQVKIYRGKEMREGLREKKRRETKLRIAESALNLFIVNGFEATTLDEIAKEAAISRRTFFSYFKSKDEIMLAW